jgi:hypothetical protein
MFCIQHKVAIENQNFSKTEVESNENTVSQATSTRFEHLGDRELKQQLKKYYFKVNDVFSSEERQNILAIFNQMTPILEFSGNGFDMLCTVPLQRLIFSTSHEMERPFSVFWDYDYLNSIQDVYINSINRFARELGLIGSHTITFKVIRLHSKNGKPFNGGWHYDVKTSKTLVIMLKNDYKYLNGKGLNIAFNGHQGPHNPNKVSAYCFPKNDEYISAKYKDGIMLDNDFGGIIHSTPELDFDPKQLDEESIVYNRQRTYIQIKLFNPNWTIL